MSQAFRRGPSPPWPPWRSPPQAPWPPVRIRGPPEGKGKPAAAGKPAAKPAFTLTIAHNNDGESALTPSEIDGAEYGGVARFSSVVDRLERSSVTGRPAAGQSGKRGFLLLNSGDNYLAGAEFNASNQPGAPFYDAVAVDYLDYDALAIGHHEFDFGPETLARFIKAVPDTTFVSANLDVSGEPSLAALAADGSIAASTVVREKGERIGVVGLTTSLLATTSSPGAVVANPDLVKIAQAQVDLLTDQGRRHHRHPVPPAGHQPGARAGRQPDGRRRRHRRRRGRAARRPRRPAGAGPHAGR